MNKVLISVLSVLLILFVSCSLDFSKNKSSSVDWSRDAAYFTVSSQGVLALKPGLSTNDLPSDLIVPMSIDAISVTGISDSVFYSNNTVKTVRIGITALTFGNFYECTALEKVILDSSVLLVEDSTFDYCSSLKTFEIYSKNLVFEKNAVTNNQNTIEYILNGQSFKVR